jgi:hypothetical protein
MHFEASLVIVFAFVVVGFWYYCALVRTFCASFKQIPEWKK